MGSWPCRVSIERTAAATQPPPLPSPPPPPPPSPPLPKHALSALVATLIWVQACGACVRGQKLNTDIFFSNFSGTAGISQQNPRISRQKSLISLVSRDIPNFLAPTPSLGRPYPNRKYPDSKVWVWVPFSFLMCFCTLHWCATCVSRGGNIPTTLSTTGPGALCKKGAHNLSCTRCEGTPAHLGP